MPKKGKLKTALCLCLSLIMGGLVLPSAGCVAGTAKNQGPKTVAAGAMKASALSAPKLTNSPSQDVVATNSRPLLSLFNATGGKAPRTYIYQVSKDPHFPPVATREYRNIPETTPFITEMRIPESAPLEDGQYHWRARAVDADGNLGPWAGTRFFVDTKNSRTFSGLVRRPVLDVMVSSGMNPKNITDWDDPGQITYWNSSPPGPQGKSAWVILDLGSPRTVSRFWMLSNPEGAAGRLTEFVWQVPDGKGGWEDLAGSERRDNDAFRNIVDVAPARSRYFRLQIRDYVGLQALIRCIIPYGPGSPPEPQAPKGDYVLVIGDQMNGFTYTMLADFIKSLGLPVDTLTVSHQDASLELVNSLSHPPVAIVVSGNDADYPNMPMFEYYGVFEIIRETRLPLLGICAGNQFSSMAYGITFARSMGWLDDTTTRMEEAARHGGVTGPVPPGVDPETGREPIRILPEYKDLPIFKNMPEPFVAVEIHSWAVSPLALPQGHVVTSVSSYVQTVKSLTRPLYGAQFHGEAVMDYNQGGQYIRNFLEMALNKAK